MGHSYGRQQRIADFERTLATDIDEGAGLLPAQHRKHENILSGLRISHGRSKLGDVSDTTGERGIILGVLPSLVR